MQRFFAAICLLFISLGVTIVEAQMPKQKEGRALTNADVVKMVRGGIPRETILLVLKNEKTVFEIGRAHV